MVNADWFLLFGGELALFGDPYEDMVCGGCCAAAVVAAFGSLQILVAQDVMLLHGFQFPLDLRPGIGPLGVQIAGVLNFFQYTPKLGGRQQ